MTVIYRKGLSTGLTLDFIEVFRPFQLVHMVLATVRTSIFGLYGFVGHFNLLSR